LSDREDARAAFGSATRTLPLQEAKVAQALGAFHDRRLQRTWAPSEFLLGPVVVNDQPRRLGAGRLFGRDPLQGTVAGEPSR